MDLAMFNQIAHITEHLFLSSAAAVKGERVRSLGITLVINCTLEIPNLAIPNLECIQIHVEDTPSAKLGVYFDKCADKIHQVHVRGGRTLVHCVAGVSRSASLCIAYLMKYQRMTLEQAYHHVKKRRPVVRPNVGFWRQLIEFERRLYGRNTVKMIPSGIGPIPDVYKEETRNMREEACCLRGLRCIFGRDTHVASAYRPGRKKSGTFLPDILGCRILFISSLIEYGLVTIRKNGSLYL